MVTTVDTIGNFVTGTISALGYPGVILLMALESACLPIPSEIVMPFSGYLASTGRFNLLLVVTVAAIGCNIGSTVAYLIGASGGRALVEKFGRYVFLNKAELDRFDDYFRRYGAITVFVARVLPMVPAVVSFPAGIAKMPFWKFQIYTFAGTWVWCFALALLGFEFGNAWRTNPALRSLSGWIDPVVLALLVLGLAWIGWRVWRRLAKP